MHPLLADMEKLGLYLVAWLILAALLVVFLSVSGGMAWYIAASLMLPLMLVYAFMCLSAWYVCRSFPLRTTKVLKLLSVFVVTAAISSSVWVLLGQGWRWILEQPEIFGVHTGPFETRELFGFGTLLYLLAAATHYTMITFETSRVSEQRALEARLHANQAELQSLRAQIDPHFLFNSLSSISTLITRKPEAARDMCLTLADFLRMSLRYGAKESITLEEELSLVRQYLAIEQIRFGPRLAVREEVAAETRGCLVPPLILQPLVENAIGHGIAHLVDGGTLAVRAGRTHATLTLAVTNPYDTERPPRRGSGLGLANVRQRLRTLYGNESSLRISDADASFTVEITLPAEETAA